MKNIKFLLKECKEDFQYCYKELREGSQDICKTSGIALKNIGNEVKGAGKDGWKVLKSCDFQRYRNFVNNHSLVTTAILFLGLPIIIPSTITGFVIYKSGFKTFLNNLKEQAGLLFTENGLPKNKNALAAKCFNTVNTIKGELETKGLTGMLIENFHHFTFNIFKK